MANQTVSTDQNHDSLTGRASGEDFTINSGATLTIDSMPHLTTMGILGDITLSNGKIHIDGRYVKEVAYSSGSGTIPTAIPTSITWDSGASTGKIIRYNSGNSTSGTVTVTVQTGTLTASDVITDGSWSATVDSVTVGFLIVYGEDQDYGGASAEDLVKITGDWYEVYTGNGNDSQTFELPHTGHQHGLWVETASGTGVYEIWHRISNAASTVFYDTFTEFGAHFEGGKVFQQTFGDATVTFGTSTNGGVIPNGAKVRIPNVHMGTTTTVAPTTEVNSTTFASHVAIIPPAVTCNVEIDHLNASSVAVNFSQTNGAVISDSAIGLAGTFIDRCAAPVTITNCCYCHSSVNTAGGVATSTVYTILDHLNGVTITDSVFYGGIDTTSAQSLWIQTSNNITFEGTNKIALSITDENTSYALRLTTASNITNNGTLICLGGGIIASASSNNVDLGDFRVGYPTGRGTTEQNQAFINATGVDNWTMSAFNIVNGGKAATLGLFLLTDCSNITLRGAGTVSSKVNLGSRATYITSLAGICSNIKLQRLFFTALNGSETFLNVNSVKGLIIENCSTDYGDEMELDANDAIVKGVHVASGAVDAATGFEGDMPNVVGSCFYDHFKSDTTGAIGILFNDPADKHAGDIEITAGTPIWNGLADLLMRTDGDQVVYTWPYSIKGHTAFQNSAIQTAGTNTTTNHSFEYSIDTGSGWSNWTVASGANLSAESISPAGFRLRVRIECTTTSTTNALKGFAILTDTTLTDQANNLYPLEVVPVTLTVVDKNNNPIENAQTAVYRSDTDTQLMNENTNASGVATENVEYSGDTSIYIRVRKSSDGFTKYYPASTVGTLTSSGYTTTVALIEDTTA